MKVNAEKCNKHFVSIGDKLAKEVQTNDEQSPTAHLKSSTTKFKFKTISVMQVIKDLKKLINSKATGIHDIPNKAFKGYC